MKDLTKTEFGNPILRKKSRLLEASEVKSARIQHLIDDMKHTLKSKKMGVGLAAPQIGQSLALAVIAVRPTPNRPKAKKFDLVMINPKITSESDQKLMWEGCLSAGSESLFAKVPRFSKITLKYLDEKGQNQHKQFTGLPAHVIQHEIDHLNGVLFVDRVEDSKTFMTQAEYKKRIVSKRRKSKAL